MMMEARMTELTVKFETAVGLAINVHRKQKRKGTELPYMTHLLGAAKIVLDDGGSEDEAIAALLHDTIEHTEPKERADLLGKIRGLFGSDVGFLVETCTMEPIAWEDIDDPQFQSWHDKRAKFLDNIDHLLEFPPSAALAEKLQRVVLADKLDNTRALIRDYQEVGEELWKRFNASKEEIYWYYWTLRDVLRHPTESKLWKEFNAIDLRRITS
jgi:(p)ppGpp synthase/HD superfamily hydrolase